MSGWTGNFQQVYWWNCDEIDRPIETLECGGVIVTDLGFYWHFLELVGIGGETDKFRDAQV